MANTQSLRHLRLVARFLAFVQNRHPMAYRRLDPDSVDWWRDRIANFGGVLDWAPRFILAVVVIIVVAVAVVTRDDSRDPAAGPADELSRTFEATDLPRLATLARQAPTRPHPAMRLCHARARLAATPEDAALAVTACDAVRTLLPASLGAMRYAGYARLKRLDAGAEALFDEVLRVSPNDAHAQIGKGLARRLAGDEAQALALIGEGAARDPDAVAYFAGFGLPVGAYTLTPSVFSRLEMPPAPQIDTPAKVATPLTQDDFDAALRANGLRAFPDGKVTVACSVSLAGRAQGCRVVEETPLDYGLADVALTIVDKATFTPGARAGVPIDAARVAIPFTFRNAPADVAPPEKTPT